MTQGDLAAAVGVERNTVSRWENDSMLPKDPAVLASLAGVLGVTTDWLIAGDPVGTVGSKLYEGAAEGQYLDPAVDELPRRARALVVEYLDRMRVHECVPAQVTGAESLLLASARNSVSTTPMEQRSDEQICADVDAGWDLVVRILRREGTRL